MKRPETAQRLRAQIRTTQLVKRAVAYALGEDDPQTGKPIEMEPHRASVMMGLIRKELPDLSSTALTDPEGNALKVLVQDDWAK